MSMRHGTLAAGTAWSACGSRRRTSPSRMSPSTSGDDLDSCPIAGLCWPDDPLDEVISYVSELKDGFLDGLGFDSLPPRHWPAAPGVIGWDEDDDDYSKSAGAMHMDVDALAAEICAAGGGKRSASGVFDGVPEHAPSMPDGGLRTYAPVAGLVARGNNVLSCCTSSTTTTATTSSCRSLTSASCGTKLPEHVSPHHAWTVPRKPRRRSAAVRKRPWPLALPLALTTAAARNSHADNNDSVYGNHTELSCSNGGGAKGRGRSRERHPNRRRQRTCGHCRASETPQWRAGPDGAGTLCNACGIRYKLGKLYPEYLPSTSPIFSSDEHSNQQSNVVMKLREKKMKAMASHLPATPSQGELLRPCKYD